MRRVTFFLALLGAGIVGAALTVALRPVPAVQVVSPSKPAVEAPAASAVLRALELVPGYASGQSEPSRPAAARKARSKAQPQRAPKARPKEAATKAVPVRSTSTKPTISLYEHTTSPTVLRAQGCKAGKAKQHGLVILAFGKVAHRKGVYGTLAFSGRFVSNRSITWAMKSFARGYSECLPKGSKASITLGRGTSNYDLDVPSQHRAGKLWAKQTRTLGLYLKRHGFTRVTAAAAIDAEPAWDRGFRRTRDFFRGFHAMHTGDLLYNFGSLDGGVGSIWDLHQAWYVSGGMRYARAVPEIYNAEMAEQWATLSRLSVKRYGKPVQFAGLMTQYKSRCNRCGFKAKEARKVLLRALARHPLTRVRTLASLTNIRWAHAMG